MQIEVARYRICFIVICCAWHVLQMQAEIADAIAKNCRPSLNKEVLCIGFAAQELSCSWGLMLHSASWILMKCSIYSIDLYVYVNMCATRRSISWMQSVLVTWVRAMRQGFAFAVHVSHVHPQSNHGRSAHADVKYLMSNLHWCACNTAYFHFTRMCIVSSRPIAVPLAYFMYVGFAPIH